MALTVVNYPTLSDDHFARIQSVRRERDRLYVDVIDPHFTLVFPTDAVSEATLIDHVQQHARATAPFVLAFGVPGAAGWLFMLPWIVAVLMIAAIAWAVQAWRKSWLMPAHRAHYTLVAAACVGCVLFVGLSGLW
jgi:hypothetical protein